MSTLIAIAGILITAALQVRMPTFWVDFGGMRIEFLPALVAYAALTMHRGRAIAIAIVAGLMQDALSAGPFGLSALAYGISAILMTTLREVLDRDLPWMQMSAGALTSVAVAMVAFFAVGISFASIFKMVLIASISGVVTVIPVLRAGLRADGLGGRMIISAPSRENNPRLRAVGTIIAGGLFLLLAALWRVQVMHGQHYDNKQDAQSLRRIRIPAARGEIVDRNGLVLANNRPSYDIAIYLDQLGVSKRSNVVAVAQASLGVLGSELGLQANLADRDIKIHYQRRRPLPLAVWRDLRPETVATFSEKASNLPGADLIVMPVREYPQGSLAAHLIGYVGKASADDDDDELEKFYYYQPDSVGKQGIEEACDEYLRGSPGGRTIRVNPAGTIAHDLGEKKAELGGRV